MAGFGSRGGLRQMGVIRQDEPMEKPTPEMPVWRLQQDSVTAIDDRPAVPAQIPANPEKKPK